MFFFEIAVKIILEESAQLVHHDQHQVQEPLFHALTIAICS